MKRRTENTGDGFEAWGGYMNAKKTKLEEQYREEAASLPEHRKQSKLFEGVAIFVNGYSEPPAEVLRRIMLQHGGVFHEYQAAGTTHVIASNLPNSKLQQKAFAKVIRPEWIIESLAAGALLPTNNYLLSARSALQSALTFQPIATDQRNKSAKTATDAAFIGEFYSNSRLHHLSTMGALLKQYVGELKDKHDGKYPGVERLKILKEEMDDLGCTHTEKVIMHIDMDSFFVSVAIRDRPELQNRPVAVTHAKGNPSHVRPGADPAAERAMYNARAGIQEGRFNAKAGTSCSAGQPPQSMADVASCSYEARLLGVRNGMYLGKALALCPGLLTVPYDFPSYTEVSYALYDTVAEYTLNVEAVSCDELFVDCTATLKAANVSVDLFVKTVRNAVTSRTRCPCSAGLGPNKLLARLASKKAKPNGQYHVREASAESFMRDISVADLPGVGWSTSSKLKKMDIETCLDLQNMPLSVMKTQLGDKTGETLYRHCRGQDDRPVVTEHQRKSVSAEMNYGIRFANEMEAKDFFKRLSGEVADRLQSLGVKGRCVTLKLMIRSANAPVETAKFLGHGVCDAASRSLMLPTATDDVTTLSDTVLKLNSQMGFPVTELRGVGIQVTKLDSKAVSGPLMSFLAKHSRNRKEKTSNNSVDQAMKTETDESKAEKKEAEKSLKNAPAVANLATKTMSHPSAKLTFPKISPKKPQKPPIPQAFQPKPSTSSNPSILPPMAELDPEVLEALPDEIKAELLAQYGASNFHELVTAAPMSVCSKNILSYSENSTLGGSIACGLSSKIPEITIDDSSNDSHFTRRRAATPDLQDESSRDSDTQATEKTLFANLPPQELRNLIEIWVESEALPQPYDVEMLAKHLAGLAFDRQLELLDIVLKCLWRCVKTHRSKAEQWSLAYKTVLDKVQDAVVLVYKAPLKVSLL